MIYALNIYFENMWMEHDNDKWSAWSVLNYPAWSYVCMKGGLKQKNPTVVAVYRGAASVVGQREQEL